LWYTMIYVINVLDVENKASRMETDNVNNTF